MFQEIKKCLECGEEFQIHHVVQRQKKYCSYGCATVKSKAKSKAKRKK